MKIFKFGGASVKDAASVRNAARILEMYSGERLFVVVSVCLCEILCVLCG